MLLSTFIFITINFSQWGSASIVSSLWGFEPLWFQRLWSITKQQQPLRTSSRLLFNPFSCRILLISSKLTVYCGISIELLRLLSLLSAEALYSLSDKLVLKFCTFITVGSLLSLFCWWSIIIAGTVVVSELSEFSDSAWGSCKQSMQHANVDHWVSDDL